MSEGKESVRTRGATDLDLRLCSVNAADSSRTLLEECSVTPLLSLNVDALLEILSYCDPLSVCYFSRTCLRAKAFVDSNLIHLSRIGAEIFASEKYEETTFELRWNNRRLCVKCKVNNLRTVFSGLKYTSVKLVTAICASTSASHARAVMQDVSSLNSEDLAFFWYQSFADNRLLFFVRSHGPREAGYLLDLSNMPLEAICGDEIFEENNKGIHQILATILQSPAYVQVELTGVPKTLDQCCSLYIDVLKDFIAAPHLVRSCSVVFETTTIEDYRFRAEEYVHYQVLKSLQACLRHMLQEKRLSSLFEVVWKGPRSVMFGQAEKPMLIIEPNTKLYRVEILQTNPLKLTTYSQTKAAVKKKLEFASKSGI